MGRNEHKFERSRETGIGGRKEIERVEEISEKTIHSSYYFFHLLTHSRQNNMVILYAQFLSTIRNYRITPN